MKPSLTSPLMWLITAIILILLLTVAAPFEKTLGANVRIVYLHGALVWTALAAFIISGISGLVGLVTRRQEWYSRSRSWGLTGLLFWLIYLPFSIWAMQTSWNGLYLSEPRWRLAVVFAVTGLLLQTGFTLLAKRLWTSIGNLFYLLALLITLVNTRNVMHPPAPILSSESVLIRGYFFLLLIILFVAAWQITRLCTDEPIIDH